MTTTMIETRNDFGYPQLSASSPEPERKPKAPLLNYRVRDIDGEEDYYDQLGAVI